MNNIVIPQKESLDHTKFCYFNNVFTPEEIINIENLASKIPYKSGGVAEGVNEEIRTSKIKWLIYEEETSWLYEKMVELALEANNILWDFSITGFFDSIQYTTYHGEQKGNYNWHMDLGPGMVMSRKISITIQLSSPDQYQGGDLEFNLEGNQTLKAPRGLGTAIVFPSYFLHRVVPVTKGVRKSLVLWIGGDHFR